MLSVDLTSRLDIYERRYFRTISYYSMSIRIRVISVRRVRRMMSRHIRAWAAFADAICYDNRLPRLNL